MKTSGTAALTIASLLAPSLWVCFRGASDEPYTTFHASEAAVQIGVASALMALWVVWVGIISAQVVKQKLHPGWLATFVVCALALCGLYQSPAGYVFDLVKFGVVLR